MTNSLARFVFGPRWDTPSSSETGSGRTYVSQAVYIHEIARLCQKVEELEVRLAKLEVQHDR